jgi:senataxin
VRNIEIGVISFYNDQVGRIKQKVKERNLMRWMNSNNISLQVSTVDGFQGSEKDIIILSCVRSRWVGSNISNDIGFLKDFRRVNVALTRAKHSLWVVAHCEMLSRDALWNQLIDDAAKRTLIAESSDLDRFLGTYKQTYPDRKRNGGTKKKLRHSKENDSKKRKGY